jgi:uncharacterized membrane-anchored protein YhcB (DUF1043 family)
LNPFHIRPTPIFALGRRKSGSDNLFSQMRRTIEHYSKGTTFEKKITTDYNEFAHKWRQTTTTTLPIQELQKVEKRKAIQECETTRQGANIQKSILKNQVSSQDFLNNAT